MARAADGLGCEVAAIRAVWQVETRGKSFDNQGRLTALFEPHHFYRLTSGDERRAAVAAGLAYPRWGTRPYPADSYPRILAAMKIDEEIALQATSWGGPQIMGFNHAMIGYPTARAMVEDFLSGEGPQVAAFAKFVRASDLAPALRMKNWTEFARRYNGAGYAKNAYDKHLAQAYAHFKVDRPMAVMIAPLPVPGAMPSTLRAETVPANAPSSSWLDRLNLFHRAA